MLAGREELLAGLHARLTEGGGDGPRIIALHGLGGAGKTSVAVEYAHRYQATAGVVWQFPAEDPTVLAAEFARLAAQLGAGGGVLDPRDPVASVHAVLAGSPAPWLLVFDNVPDQDAVRAFLPPAGDGQVLITSQSVLWPPGQDVELPVLDTGVAAGFLTARTGDPDRQTAADLAGELGGLPLAPEQAASYIQATAGSLAGYLAAFRQRRPDRLVQAVTVDQMPGGLAGQWQAAAAALIEDAIPDDTERPETWPVFEALLPHAQVVLADDSDGIDRLAAYLGERGSYASALELERRFGDALERSLGPGHPCTLAARVHLAYWTGRAGDAAGARDQSVALLPVCERVCGPEHPETLSARGNLARWTGEAGDAAAARDQFMALLPVCERVLGPEHPWVTMAIRTELARWTGRTGDAAGARDQYAALLTMRVRVLGPEHPHTLDTRDNLARWTGEAGDSAAARDLFAALLPVRERVSGPEHNRTLMARHELARWTGEAGDPAAARDLDAALLPVRERVLAPSTRTPWPPVTTSPTGPCGPRLRTSSRVITQCPASIP